MSNATALRIAVDDFVQTARAKPAEAVGPALEKLAQSAKDSRRVSDAVAVTAPLANTTWMSRATLAATARESNIDPLQIPYACTIVGALPTVLLVDTGANAIEPPMDAIDMFLQIDRRETFTARTDRITNQQQDSQVVNLSAFNPRRSLRIIELQLRNEMNVVSVRFRWAVDLTLVAAFNWGDVQISINWFVDKERP